MQKDTIDPTFMRIAIDTCCSHYSTGGIEQYLAYCAFVGTETNLDSTRSSNVTFGIGKTVSKGIAQCVVPVGDIHVKIEVHVVNADVPIFFFSRPW